MYIPLLASEFFEFAFAAAAIMFYNQNLINIEPLYHIGKIGSYISKYSAFKDILKKLNSFELHYCQVLTLRRAEVRREVSWSQTGFLFLWCASNPEHFLNDWGIVNIHRL